MLYFRAAVLLFLTLQFGLIGSGLGANQDLVVSHLTGPEGGIGSRDGRGTAARFNSPSGIWAQGGDLYVADSSNFTIRKISIATADVTTIAGSPQQSGSVDGVGVNARFGSLGSRGLLGAIWGDGSNLYVQDSCTVRKIVTSTGAVSTFAGVAGVPGVGGGCGKVDGTNNVARLGGSRVMSGDGTNLYWIDPGSLGFRGFGAAPATIRIITLATGNVRSIPVPQIADAITVFGPAGIWGSAGYVYMMFSTISNSIAFARINIDTQQAEMLFNVPTACNCSSLSGLWFDNQDTFYFVEKNTLRRIKLSSGNVESIAALPAATVNGPVSITGSGDDVFVADSGDSDVNRAISGASIVSRVHLSTRQVTVFAGLQSNVPPEPPRDFSFGFLKGAWTDGRYVYTVGGHEVVRVDLATKAAVVIASGFNNPVGIWGDSAFVYVVDYGYGVVYRVDLSTGIPTPLATMLIPLTIWGDSTYLYVTAWNTVRRITKATGDTITIAGKESQPGTTDGIGTDARFQSPSGIWGDSTYLYIADTGVGIRRIRISTGEVTTLTTQVNLPIGLTGDGTNVYVGDYFFSIKKIVIATAEVTNVLAAFGGLPVWNDGQSLYFINSRGNAVDRISLATGELSRVTPPAEFSEGSVPSDRIQVKASWSDGTFLYGFSGGAIYKVRIATGEIIPIAGAFDEFGLVDGVGSHARFQGPTSVWGDGAYLYVVDYNPIASGIPIRRINLATQQVDSFGGFLPQRVWGDGRYLYLTDKTYQSIERASIATHEMVQVAGTQELFLPKPFRDGVGTAARFRDIGAIWGDGTNLYVSDSCTIRRVAISNFNVTTFVGVPDACAHVDGSKDVARFQTINDIWGNGRLLYVASGHAIRTVDLVTGETRTLAGNPALTGTESGSALAARFIGPDRIVGDGVNLYVSDNGIRKISTMTSTQTFTISANGVNYRATPPGDSLIQGYARLQATSGSANADGIAIFSYRSGGVLVSETSVQASPLIQSGRVYAESSGGVRTGIAIANPNNTSAALTFYFTDKDGANFGGGTTTIPPNQQIVAFLNDTPFNGSAAAQTFTFSSSVPVGAVALRGFVNERSDFLMTTLPVAPIVSTSSSQIVVPHSASGGGWTTQILLVNPTDQSVNGSVVIDGASTFYSIAPRSATKVVRSDPAGQVRTGMVIVTPASGNPAPVVSSVFTFVSNLVTVTEGGVATVGTAQSFRVLAEFDPIRAMTTGIAIANAGSLTANVQYELFDLAGQLVTPVPPHCHRTATLGYFSTNYLAFKIFQPHSVESYVFQAVRPYRLSVCGACITNAEIF